MGTPSYTDGDGWLTATPTQGTGDDVNTLSVTLDANTGTADRSGSVALTPTNSVTSVDGDYVYLDVHQAWAEPTLSINPASLSSTNPATLSFTASETDTRRTTITLENADTWTVSTPDSWLTATQGTGAAPNTLTVRVSENTGTDPVVVA